MDQLSILTSTEADRKIIIIKKSLDDGILQKII